MSIRILLADDHQIVLDGLRALIDNVPKMMVVAEAANGRRAVELVREQLPDLAILDVGMPELNGIEAGRKIVAEFPAVKVLVLSMYADKRFIVGAFEAGAMGYVLKDCAFQELTYAVRTVMDDKMYLSPAITDVVMKDYVTKADLSQGPDYFVLTPREREVLQLLAEGKSVKEIAPVLEVSSKTVETHRHHIMEKLDLYNLAELTKFALRTGLTFLEEPSG